MHNSTQTRWTANTILDFLRNHTEELKAMGVVKIGLFGSYVRGEQSPDSDMDFLAEFESVSYRNYMNLWHFLEDSFGVKVDLGEPHTLREEIRHHVIKEVRYVEMS
jgi:predicted nucleotidyltransferase